MAKRRDPKILSLLREDVDLCSRRSNRLLSIIVFGASGDLASRMIYPTLWDLFADELLPKNVLIYGYARSPLTVEKIREKSTPYMNIEDDEKEKYEQFWTVHRYFKGSYDKTDDFVSFSNNLVENEDKIDANGHRLFYLALPPSVFDVVAANVSDNCLTKCGWNRIVIEKPFGRDSQSSQHLSTHLAKYFEEEEIYRMDHYLGKEMVQNLMILR